LNKLLALVALAFLSTSLMAEKPSWAGDKNPPSKEEVQKHKEQMQNKNKQAKQKKEQQAKMEQAQPQAAVVVEPAVEMPPMPPGM
jgi:flagellar biosynthesis component FlhA